MNPHVSEQGGGGGSFPLLILKTFFFFIRQRGTMNQLKAKSRIDILSMARFILELNIKIRL